MRLQQRHGNRRQMIGTGLAALGAMLAGCGRPGGKGKNPTPGTLAGHPRYGGQLRFASTSDPRTFAPLSKDAGAAGALSSTNDALLRFKAGPGVKYSEIAIEPHLAQRWETPDPQTYIFHLQPNVAFASLPPVNGRALTSADVKWTFEYLSRTGQFKGASPAETSSMYTGLSSMETPDAATIVSHFAHPSAPFLHYVASDFSSILAHEVFEQDNFSNGSVGSGPWQLDQKASQKGARWVYRKNPNYFQKGLPYLDEIDNVIIADQSTANAAFEAGQLDVISYIGLMPDTIQQIQKAVPHVVVSAPLDKRAYHLDMKVATPPFHDIRVRQAVSFSLDHDEFIRVFAKGKGQWAFACSIPDLFTEQEVKNVYQYDPARAQQLIRDAGFPDGIHVDVPYQTGYGQSFVSVMQLLQAQLKKTGINLTLIPTETATIQKMRRARKLAFDVNPSSGPGTFQLDLDDAVYGKSYPTSGSNYAGIDDPKLTAMLDAERQEMDPAKRTQIIRNAIQYANTVPWVLGLFFAPRYMAWSSRVKNYGGPSMTTVDPGYITQSWLEG